MKISVNTVKQLVGHELPPNEDLIDRINQQLGGVEAVEDLGAKYKDSTIVKIVECNKHPNADRLSVCMIDAGRDELVQVVCGAPNVRADMWAIWLPPDSTVPSTFDDAEPFVLGARELRGVMSNGMLAAGDELSINSDHDGIVELTEADMPAGATLTAGASFAEAFSLNDTIITIENKMFTHRPDLFGQLGVAREIFAILQPEPSHDTPDNIRFPEPDWYWSQAEFDSHDGVELSVFNDIPELVPRAVFTVLDGIEVKPSPLWLQTTLVRWGAKPINNVVDVTNYVMLLTAQPTHAYDYDKLRGATIGARMARAGETITLLNGKTYELTVDDMVISDGEGPVGLGGIMGGGESEVSADTTRIVLEVASFDMYAARKSSMRHGVFTDALARFNKGQSPLQNDRAMERLIHYLTSMGAARKSPVFDFRDGIESDDYTSVNGSIIVSAASINSQLGLQLTPLHIGNLLRFANFAAYTPEDADADVLSITAPFWRTDIAAPEDIVEEVGRLYGFDKLPRQLPQRSARPARLNDGLITKKLIRDTLSRSGANEVLTYSFVHERLLARTGQDTTRAYKLSNALSPDLQFYRLGLTSSLLDKVNQNIRAGYDSFALFEIGKVHIKPSDEMSQGDIPEASDRVALVVSTADKLKPDGAAYFVAQNYLRQLVRAASFDLRPVTDELLAETAMVQMAAPYDRQRSALVVIDGKVSGMVGEYRHEVRRALKLPIATAGFEVLVESMKQGVAPYSPLSRFPSVSQDISIRTADVPYGVIETTIREAVEVYSDSLRIRVTPTVIYRPETSDGFVTTTFRVVMTSDSSTLKDADVKPVMDTIAKAVSSAFDGTVV